MKCILSRLVWLMALGAPVLITGCGGKKKPGESDLADAGYQLTEADWFRAAADDDAPAMGKFLRAGITVSIRNAEGNSALHLAAAAGARESAKFLLDHKLPINDLGALGRTPLMEAVRAGRTDMVKWLLRQGADPSIKDSEGYKALMIAVREDRAAVIGDLAAADRSDLDGALLAASLMGRTKVVDELSKYGASVYARMDDGRTALMVAAENGHAETTRLLLDLGANRFTKDEGGQTAAELAREAGHTDLATLLSSDATAQELALGAEDDLGKEMVRLDEDRSSLPSPSEGPSSNTPSDEAAGNDARAAVNPGPATGGGTGDGTGSGRSPRVRSGTAVALGGQTLENPTAPPSSASGVPPAVGSPRQSVPPLVMRSYRERELPIEVKHVEGNSARLTLRGTTNREVKVSEGESIPGSTLKVLRVRQRYTSEKDSAGPAVESSIVEVEDSTTGIRRNLTAGSPSFSHDPIALVEDSGTGRRYLASPGQQFTGADGSRYTVTDVRPNQIVVEHQDSGTSHTLPLRGPRG